MKTLKASVACVLAIGLLLPALAFAQGDARFAGVVLDPSGAVVPGATVLVKNERTGEERTVVTNTEGRYIVTNLRPSVYTIRATFGQLAPLQFDGLQLVAGQEFPLDLTLQAAGVTETVTVQAQVTAIDLSSASVGVNVSEREVLNLPVNGRQMSQLMLQAPGSQNAGTGTWSDVRFSGRESNQNVVKFDGVEGSAIIDASPGNIGGQIASPFKLQASLENVQEFRVESNNYPAEHGTGTGGQVNVITKSGSNLFRGAVFEYYRDDALDAPNYFDSTRNADGSVIDELPKSKLNQHQFGGSFGGPFMKDRAFFFGSYEGYRLDAGVNFVEAAPSASAWARAVPAIAALRPGFTSPDAVLLPGTSTNPDFDIYQLQGLETVDEDAFSLRLDYRWNQQWNSYFRYFRDEGTQVRPEGVSGRVVTVTNTPTNAIFNLQGTMGGGLLNEFKLGFNQPVAEVQGVAPTAGGIDYSNIAINLTGSIANTGIAGQSASSGIVYRVVLCARTAQRMAVDSSTIRIAGLHRHGDFGARQSPHEDRRRGALHSDGDRSARWHDVFLPQRHCLPRESAVRDSVCRRHQRPERVQQRRHRPAPYEAGVLRRIRTGRVARLVEPDLQLRSAVRILHTTRG